MPRNNMFKIGIATAAAGAGAILAITSVFAHTAPTTGGTSLVGSIMNAANGASIPDFSKDPVSNLTTAEAEQDAAEAAALAAKIAAEQQAEAAELAAKQAALAAEQAAEAAEAAETDEDVNVEETGDNDTDQGAAPATTTKVKTEHHDSGGND